MTKPGVLPWRPDHLRRAIEAAGVTLWSWNVDTDELTMDEQAFALWGLPHRGCFGGTEEPAEASDPGDMEDDFGSGF